MLADFGTKLVPKADPNRPHSRQSRSNYRHPSGFLLRCYVGTVAGFAAGKWIYLFGHMAQESGSFLTWYLSTCL